MPLNLFKTSKPQKLVPQNCSKSIFKTKHAFFGITGGTKGRFESLENIEVPLQLSGLKTLYASWVVGIVQLSNKLTGTGDHKK